MANDYFSFKRFTVWQRRAAMRVGTDGVLLGAWFDPGGDGARMLDVGTGTGVIALMAAQRNPSARSKSMPAVVRMPRKISPGRPGRNAWLFSVSLSRPFAGTLRGNTIG